MSFVKNYFLFNLQSKKKNIILKLLKRKAKKHLMAFFIHWEIKIIEKYREYSQQKFENKYCIVKLHHLWSKYLFLFMAYGDAHFSTPISVLRKNWYLLCIYIYEQYVHVSFPSLRLHKYIWYFKIPQKL